MSWFLSKCAGVLIRISLDPPLVVGGLVLGPSSGAITISGLLSSSVRRELKVKILSRRLEKAVAPDRRSVVGSGRGSKSTAEYERFSVSDPVGDPCGASSYRDTSDPESDCGARKVDPSPRNRAVVFRSR